MRVVAGIYGGRKLVAPPGARPGRRATACARRCSASSAPRSTMHACSICSPAPARSASRRSRAGRASAVFVDSSRKAIAAVRANLEALGIDADVRPIAARAALRAASGRAEAYDLVFLDPPYRRAAELGRELSEGLAAVLAPGARVVTESDRRAPLQLDLPLADERRYGDTVIRIHDT